MRNPLVGAPRLLFVHAHPDDETINNGVTIARYAAAGAQVSVLTCTLGEEGEVIGPRWAQLAADQADQLGGYRIGELTAALAELGVAAPQFLGGAGCWRDSGMAGAPAPEGSMAGAPRRGRTRFVDAGPQAVAHMADAIAELRPHVVVTYDPGGGYGHPDHIHTHRVTVAALDAAADRWEVPKFYWTVTSATAFGAALDTLGSADVDPEWMWPPGDYGFPDDQITTEVAAPERLPAKVAAMRAYPTQMTVGPTGRAFSLSNNMVLPILGHEHYILAGGALAGAMSAGETDLLAGIDLR